MTYPWGASFSFPFCWVKVVCWRVFWPAFLPCFFPLNHNAMHLFVPLWLEDLQEMDQKKPVETRDFFFHFVFIDTAAAVVRKQHLRIILQIRPKCSYLEIRPRFLFSLRNNNRN